MPKPKVQIVQDSREQDPLVFPSREIEVVVEGLEVGDYGIKIENKLADIRVERKGLSDLFGSFSGDAYRREKEKIKRAKDAGLRYILAVEASCSRVRKGCQYYKGGAWHQVQKDGLTQVRQLETISKKYEVELRYCTDRDDMAFQVQEVLLAYVRSYESNKKV